MPKKIELSKDEQKLYLELNKLIKKANQRILRIERLTGVKGGFATKQLYDYLSVSNLQSITKTGRIKSSKNYSISQMLAIKKATTNFLESGLSTVKEIKRKKKEYELKIEKPLSFKNVSVLYISGKNYTWIYEYIPKSEFWSIVQVAKNANWTKDQFIEEIIYIAGFKNIDEELKVDLESLAIYVSD